MPDNIRHTTSCDAVEKPIRPLLRWAGSKRKLLPYLLPYWQERHKRYIEPFAGSACLFFAIKPPCAIISDVNEALIDAYKTICVSPLEVHEHLVNLPRGKEEYYNIRAQETHKMTSIEKAARFIYLNRFCFNGLYRTNLNGKFNVPYAPSKTGDIPSKAEFVTAALLLKRAEILCCDFEEIIDTIQPGDLIYMDPPYAVSGRRVFREYGAKCFGLEDINRFSKLLKQIVQNGADFVVSYADCEEAKCFGEWPTQRAIVQRNIAGFSKFRRCDTELLISNFTPMTSN